MPPVTIGPGESGGDWGVLDAVPVGFGGYVRSYGRRHLHVSSPWPTIISAEINHHNPAVLQVKGDLAKDLRRSYELAGVASAG